MLAGLAAAHARGVLHRAVRPGNIVVNDGPTVDEVALVDFGLAGTARLDPGARDEWAGTAEYLSPEAAGLIDHDVTACSDLYSLGVVLFECLAGHTPFQAGSVGEVLRRHMSRPRRSCAASGCRCRASSTRWCSGSCGRTRATGTSRQGRWRTTSR